MRAIVLLWVLLPACLDAAPWPQVVVDPRLTPDFSGRIVIPIAPGVNPSLPVDSGTECDLAYVTCSPPLDCPSVLHGASGFGFTNPLSPSNGLYTQVDVTLSAGGACFGQGTQLLRFGFPSDAAYAGFEGCVACAFEMAAALRGATVCPVNCGPIVADLCDAFGGTAPAGPQPAGAAPNLIDTLRLLRDQHLANSDAGQRWIALYDTHSPALSRVLWDRPGLGVSIGTALVKWFGPLVQLVNGQGANATITPAMMDAWLAIVDEFAANAPPDTQAAIATERTLLDLPSYVGLTMEAALAQFETSGGCGTGFAGADCTLAALAADDLCGADPIEPALLKVADQRVQSARALLGKAAASTKTKMRRKLIGKAARQLDAIAKRTRRAKHTSASCRTTIAALLGEGRSLVTGLVP